MVGESIDDTLLDLANYAILELIERKIDREKNSEKTDKAYKVVYKVDGENTEFETFKSVTEVEQFIINKNWNTTDFSELVSIEMVDSDDEAN